MDDFSVADGGVRDRVFHGGQLKSERMLKCPKMVVYLFPPPGRSAERKESSPVRILQGDFFCLSAKSRGRASSRDTVNQLRPTRKAVIVRCEARCVCLLYCSCKSLVY